MDTVYIYLTYTRFPLACEVDPEIDRVDRLTMELSRVDWPVKSRVDRTSLKSSQSTFNTYEVNEIGSVITYSVTTAVGASKMF